MLHKMRPSVYKDPNHKPEMAIALTEFRALCGFVNIEVHNEVFLSYFRIYWLFSDQFVLTCHNRLFEKSCCSVMITFLQSHLFSGGVGGGGEYLIVND